MFLSKPGKLDDLESQQQHHHHHPRATVGLSATSSSASPPSRTPTFVGDDGEKKQRFSSGSTSTLAHFDEEEDIGVKSLTKQEEAEGSPNVAVERSQPIPQSKSSSRTHLSQAPGQETPNEKENIYEVTWDGHDDPQNPYNWSRTSRWYYTILGSILVFNATFASSSPGGIVPKVMREFTFSEEVATLMITMFLVGYCVGPLFWGPLSEIYGRKPIFVWSFFLYTGLQVGCALSPNTGSILVFRFLGGCAASSPLANAGALIGDIWDQKTRGKAVALFTLAPFAGPALGPVVGGFIGDSPTASWRWLFWVLTIFAGACTVAVIFTLPETYAPVLLKQKAERLRKETGDERYYALIERNKPTPSERIKNVVTKPFKILFLEPMLLAITVYMSFVYGCLYVLFESYPIVFIRDHGFNLGENGLAFLPLFVGAMIGTIISVGYYNPRYVKLLDQYAPEKPPPEARLPMGIVGGVIFAIGFFWFGWTSYASVSYWAPLTAGLAFGVSLMFLFLSLLNYIIDVYLSEAASALSANTILRSIFGATFPLFAKQMYEALNPRWASTLLGGVAVIMIPIPVLFIRYGAQLRRKSRYSPTA